jgi:hypothetical protein
MCACVCVCHQRPLVTLSPVPSFTLWALVMVGDCGAAPTAKGCASLSAPLQSMCVSVQANTHSICRWPSGPPSSWFTAKSERVRVCTHVLREVPYGTLGASDWRLQACGNDASARPDSTSQQHAESFSEPTNMRENSQVRTTHSSRGQSTRHHWCVPQRGSEVNNRVREQKCKLQLGPGTLGTKKWSVSCVAAARINKTGIEFVHRI